MFRVHIDLKGCVKGAFRGSQWVTRDALRVRLVCVKGAFRVHLGCVSGVFRVCLGCTLI